MLSSQGSSDASCAQSTIIDRARASLANRVSFKRAVFSRVARAFDSYSVVAFRPSCARASFLKCLSAISRALCEFMTISSCAHHCRKTELLFAATGCRHPLNGTSAGKREAVVCEPVRSSISCRRRSRCTFESVRTRRTRRYEVPTRCRLGQALRG